MFLANRAALLRFVIARGAGDAAEDVLQDVWLKIAKAGSSAGPIAAPLPYLYRAANSVMIDRFRAQRQSAARESAWHEHREDTVPTPERITAGRQEVAGALRALEQAGPRASLAFRRHRIDGVSQRDLAAELGVALSTVESDLRTAYRIISEFRERGDEV